MHFYVNKKKGEMRRIKAEKRIGSRKGDGGGRMLHLKFRFLTRKKEGKMLQKRCRSENFVWVDENSALKIICRRLP
jgi:hypothetical protein